MDIRRVYSVRIVCAKYTWSFPWIGKLEFDPNGLPAEWGQACFMTLTPTDSGMPDLTIEIPDGATPVLHMVTRQSMLNGAAIRKIRAGYKQGNTRYMQTVDVNGNTGNETDTVEG